MALATAALLVIGTATGDVDIGVDVVIGTATGDVDMGMTAEEAAIGVEGEVPTMTVGGG